MFFFFFFSAIQYLAVLQVNQDQKHQIENLCKEKATIANEYEAEFNRMNVRRHISIFVSILIYITHIWVNHLPVITYTKKLRGKLHFMVSKGHNKMCS